MHSVDGVEQNVKRIADLFPNCVTETTDEQGNVRLAVDYDKLRVELGEVVEGSEERYQFTWPGKRDAMRLANSPIAAALRPVREESVDFDTTQNLYIEGDNLDVLKLLRENYLGKVKMIYIDPPYNTGNDFVYEDDFSQATGDYLANSGQFDDQGNRLVANTESNGRFHTDWLNMIYPRLKVARDLLTDDGVIFISIDDNEQDNLKRVCNEVFGQQNFVAQLVWERAYSPKNDARFISNSHDYVLMFAKNINSFVIGRLERTEEANARYTNPDNDPRGVWKPSDMSVKTYNAESDYPITTPSGRIVEPPAGRCWSLSKNAFFERLQDNRIWFGPNGDGVPCIKRFLTELKFDGMAPTSILFYKEVGHSQEGAKELVSLMGDKGVFDGPKPVRLLERLLTLANLNDDSIVLDFFSGSATTAHALMKRNAEKNTHCQFIMVQLPEKVSEKKKDQGYETICEIGKERIRRAGKKILEELGMRKEELGNKQGGLFDESNSSSQIPHSSLDVGFRVLRLDSSNMEDVFYTPDKFDAANLFTMTDNVKADRSEEDLLFQVMLELDVPLSAGIRREELGVRNYRVFNVDDGHLIACFAPNLDETTVTEIAKQKPNFFVMRDASATNDNVLDNFEQIFNAYSPDTICRVL